MVRFFSYQSTKEKASDELNDMGKKLNRKEWIMLSILVILLLLWSTKFIHGMGSALVAWIGVGIMLITNTQKWSEIISNSKAWDTLIWLGGLLTMANMLKTHGLIDWMVSNIEGWVVSYNGLMIVIILGLIYFYSMYMFSMLTAHISAMAYGLLVVLAAAGGQPLIAACIFAYFSCLCGCLTTYSTGPVIIYFGLDYVKSSKWFSTGFIISLFHIAIWLGIGLIWWKILGWW